MSDFASEGGHWYHWSGEPAYTCIGKNGKERPNTIRDARSQGLYPSVTTVIGCSAKPGLVNWQIEQGILAALTLPRVDGEATDALLKRIRADGQEYARKAREKGTEIHGAIERNLCGLPYDGAYATHVQAAMTQLAVCGPQQWASEKSFAHPSGYGGKIDLHTAKGTPASPWLLDFKGTEKESPSLWDEHFMQLAAYRRGIGMHAARCAIVFLDRSDNGRALLLEADEDGLQRGLKMFDALLDFWWARSEAKGYQRKLTTFSNQHQQTHATQGNLT